MAYPLTSNMQCFPCVRGKKEEFIIILRNLPIKNLDFMHGRMNTNSNLNQFFALKSYYEIAENSF